MADSLKECRERAQAIRERLEAMDRLHSSQPIDDTAQPPPRDSQSPRAPPSEETQGMSHTIEQAASTHPTIAESLRAQHASGELADIESMRERLRNHVRRTEASPSTSPPSKTAAEPSPTSTPSNSEALREKARQIRERLEGLHLSASSPTATSQPNTSPTSKTSPTSPAQKPTSHSSTLPPPPTTSSTQDLRQQAKALMDTLKETQTRALYTQSKLAHQRILSEEQKKLAAEARDKFISEQEHRDAEAHERQEALISQLSPRSAIISEQDANTPIPTSTSRLTEQVVQGKRGLLQAAGSKDTQSKPSRAVSFNESLQVKEYQIGSAPSSVPRLDLSSTQPPIPILRTDAHPHQPVHSYDTEEAVSSAITRIRRARQADDCDVDSLEPSLPDDRVESERRLSEGTRTAAHAESLTKLIEMSDSSLEWTNSTDRISGDGMVRTVDQPSPRFYGAENRLVPNTEWPSGVLRTPRGTPTAQQAPASTSPRPQGGEFKCTACGRVFKRETHLRVHSRVHEREAMQSMQSAVATDVESSTPPTALDITSTTELPPSSSTTPTEEDTQTDPIGNIPTAQGPDMDSMHSLWKLMQNDSKDRPDLEMLGQVLGSMNHSDKGPMNGKASDMMQVMGAVGQRDVSAVSKQIVEGRVLSATPQADVSNFVSNMATGKLSRGELSMKDAGAALGAMMSRGMGSDFNSLNELQSSSGLAQIGAAVATQSTQSALERAEREWPALWSKWIAKLSAKGYLDGVTPGTDQHRGHLERAAEKFLKSRAVASRSSR